MAITTLDLTALRLRGEATGSSFEHRVPVCVVDGDCSSGLAADAQDGLATQEAQILEVG